MYKFVCDPEALFQMAGPGDRLKVEQEQANQVGGQKKIKMLTFSKRGGGGSTPKFTFVKKKNVFFYGFSQGVKTVK